MYNFIEKANKIHNNKFDYSIVEYKIYLPDFNLCIEYDGRQHFEPIQSWGGLETFEVLKENDFRKDEFCKQENINMLRISYQDFNNIESILDNYLKMLPKKLVCNYRLPKNSDDFTKVLNSFETKPFKVILCPKPNCFENDCHNNVDRYVNMYGGSKISGYYLVYDLDYNRFIAIRHSIWKNTYNQKIDITPFSDSRKWNLFVESSSPDSILCF